MTDAARLDALAALDVMDTAAEPAFDDIVTVAAALCATPVALVSLLDGERQWFKARTGLDASETPVGQAVCAHVLGRSAPLVIPDLTADPRTADNPLVTGDPAIRFYAGAPLTSGGQPIGTLCVIDTVARPEGLTEAQLAGLAALARQVMLMLEMRRSLHLDAALLAQERRTTARLLDRPDRSQGAADASADALRLDAAQAAGRIGSFDLDVASGTLNVSAQFCRLFGLPVAPSYPAADIQALVFDEDREWEPSGAARGGAGEAPRDTEYRIRRPDNGQVRWISRRAMFERGGDGAMVRMFGTVHDVTTTRTAIARMTAIIELGDRLRASGDTPTIIAAASEALGRTLGASRAGFATIADSGATVVVEDGWLADGSAPAAGRYARETFAATLARLARDGSLTVANIPAAEWLAGDRAVYATLDARAQIAISLMVAGQTLGVLYVQSAEARTWTDAETEFVHGVADRTWAALGKLRAEADQQLLNQEVGHRLKNSLAMVQALALQTLKGVSDRAAVGIFEKRLQAFAGAHELLLRDDWSGADLGDIAAQTMRALGQAGRVSVSGPAVALGPKAALSTALILHELATNSIKYGALSAAGRVDLDWTLGQGDDAELVVTWRERGGPPAAPPARTGFGSRLIASGLLGRGGASVRYETLGLVAELRAPHKDAAGGQV